MPFAIAMSTVGLSLWNGDEWGGKETRGVNASLRRMNT